MYDDCKRPDKFKEAVCIEAKRIFDTCSERDCISDLTVVLDQGYELTDSMTVVKTRCAEVSNVCITVDEVAFKNGYYAVDITYTFRITIDAYEKACTDEAIPLKGSAVWNKRVILYGSSANIKTFSNDEVQTGETKHCCGSVNMPKVSVSVVEPIALETKIDCIKVKSDCAKTKVREILITLGLFSVVQLSRPVSLLIPTYDYCIPDKECSTPSESPCDVFDKLDFPKEEFFPKAPSSILTDTDTSVSEYDYLPEDNDLQIN